VKPKINLRLPPGLAPRPLARTPTEYNLRIHHPTHPIIKYQTAFLSETAPRNPKAGNNPESKPKVANTCADGKKQHSNHKSDSIYFAIPRQEKSKL
jgi:hypothetical protein